MRNCAIIAAFILEAIVQFRRGPLDGLLWTWDGSLEALEEGWCSQLRLALVGCSYYHDLIESFCT